LPGERLSLPAGLSRNQDRPHGHRLHGKPAQIQSEHRIRGSMSAIRVKLINRSQVKQFALDMAKNRAHKFTRVGGPFFLQCEANLKEFIRNYVRRLPSKGKTIN